MSDSAGSDSELAQAAREWYHRALPGGMPIDWIHDNANDPKRLARGAMAAALFWAGRLHLDSDGNGTDYSDQRYANCVLCRPPTDASSEER